jgi:hypothetical protein
VVDWSLTTNWERETDYPGREDVTGNLEMYSHDVYVALDPDSVLMGPLRRA